jgi:putative spermidine/putrescine transport system ATP-binding protein
MSLPPERRPVNLVFQRYALFPHLTVHENVAFGLRVAGMSTAETDRRVGEALGTVSLEGYGARHVEELSGGQQQRVAVARAIVNEPQLLLLDEPLGALDLQLRKTMQSELRSLQRRLGTTFLYVTHDQEEALVLSDRIAILENGRVAQIGTAEEIYRRPATRFVAGFVGDTNLLPSHLSGGMANGEEAISVRPEDISLDGAGEVELEGVVADVVFLGPVRRVIVDVGGTQVKVDCAPAAGAGVAPGDRVTASWKRVDGTKVA